MIAEIKKSPTVFSILSEIVFVCLPPYLAANYYITYHKDILRIEGNSMSPTLIGSSLSSTLTPHFSPPPSSRSRGDEDRRRQPRRDAVIVNKRLWPTREELKRNRYASWTPERGAIVSFMSPSGGGSGWWDSRPKTCIKRIVAVEGDTVTPLRRKVVRVDKLPDRERDDKNSGSRFEGVYDPQGRTCPRSTLHQTASLTDGSEPEPETEAITIPYNHVWVEGDCASQSMDSNDYGPISKSLITGQASGIWRDWFSIERPIWVDDGWEGRMACRLRKRKETESDGALAQAASEEEAGVPKEWRMYH